MDQITEYLCRVYPISCPACGNEHRFPRLKRDIFRASNQEPDGHPLEISWRTEGEFPVWVTPLDYFWTTCNHCFYTAQVDDSNFRQWKKQPKKFLELFRQGALDNLAAQVKTEQGIMQTMGKSLDLSDPFGTLLIKFSLGIFSECLKTNPLPGTLGRANLRIAWIYRDADRLYNTSLKEAKILPFLKETASIWNSEIPPNSNFPIQPEIIMDEISALRQALAFFEWNFISLQEAMQEDEMRLMTLISEIGYRIYELTGLEDDFTKGRTLFSGTMQKCLSVINNKNMVGGVVNRAKDTLEKVGERGREFRTLKQKWLKNPTFQANKVISKPTQPNHLPGEISIKPTQINSDALDPPTAPGPPPNNTTLESTKLEEISELNRKIVQLQKETKQWMRLASISELTGLPNRVMISKVLLRRAIKQANSRQEPFFGCILISPDGIAEINGKYGRSKGDYLILKFSKSLKELLQDGEQLCHLESINFVLIIPQTNPEQLKNRAIFLHKTLTQRQFELDGDSFSLKICIGVSGLEIPNQGDFTKQIQESLYTCSFQAIDTAKLKGNQIEFNNKFFLFQ